MVIAFRHSLQSPIWRIISYPSLKSYPLVTTGTLSSLTSQRTFATTSPYEEDKSRNVLTRTPSIVRAI